MRHVICSGEALPKHLQDRYLDKLPAALHNLYGPTEASIDVTAWTCRPTPAGYVPIGRPIDNITVFVLDDELRPFPDGVVGELFIGGVGLAHGYLKRPELTRAAFVDSPLTAGPGRLYRTGDLARRHDDGTLEYCGRRGRQVKVRGFRIELGEVESRMRDLPNVQEAVASTERTEAGADRLVAFLRLGGGAVPALASVRDGLARHLPEYMIPAQFRVVDRMPLTANGKTDVAALHRMPSATLSGGRRPVPPRDDTERVLAGLWRRVLATDGVGVHDDFFELGGDSLLGLRLITLAAAAGLRLTTEDLFQHRTIARLAPVLRGRVTRTAEQGPATGDAPSTPSQRRFFQYGLARPDHWAMPLILHARHPVDAHALQQALDAVATHHDALRTRMSGADGQAVPEATGSVPLSVIDAPAGRSDDLHQTAAGWLSTAGPGLAISAGRPVVAGLLRHRDGDLVVLCPHHLVMDGVSWRIVAEDLDAAYRAVLAGRPASPDLPPKTTPYLQWARCWEDLTASPALEPDRHYWTTSFSAPAEVGWPGGGTGRTAAARIHRHTVNRPLTDRLLRVVPRSLGVRMDEILVAALWMAVREVAHTPALFLDLEGHGRDHLTDQLAVARTVGWFTSIFPVHLDRSAGASPLDLLGAVRTHLRGIPHRGTGYGMLRYQSRDDEMRRRLAAPPHPTIKFNYLGRFDDGPAGVLTVAPRQVVLESANDNVRSHRIDVVGLVSPAGLEMEWEYLPDVDARATVEEAAAAFDRALHLLADVGDDVAGAAADLPVDAGRSGLGVRDLQTLATILATTERQTDDV